MLPKGNKSSISIAPGFRAAIRITPLTGCNHATFAPYFGASPPKGALKPFLISKYGYEGAFEAALTYYSEARGLSPAEVQALREKMPQRSEFIALRSHLARKEGCSGNEREFLRELFAEPSGSAAAKSDSEPSFDDPNSWFIR